MTGLPFSTIESHEFSARANVASSFVHVLRVASTDPAFKKLDEALASHANQSAVLGRILELLKFQVDVRYESPYDVALMIYLALLRGRDRRLAFLAAAFVAKAPNLWWAARYARDILHHRVGDVRNSSRNVDSFSDVSALSSAQSKRARVISANDTLYILAEKLIGNIFSMDLKLGVSIVTSGSASFGMELLPAGQFSSSAANQFVDA